MNSSKKISIAVGVLFIIATVAGILSAAFLKYIDVSDYLVQVSANETQIITGALFILIMAFTVAGIAIVVYPLLRKQNESLALGYVVARSLEGLLFIVGVITIMSLLTMSKKFVGAGAPDDSWFSYSGELLLAVRDWIFLIGSHIVFSLGALMFYYLLYQTKLVPHFLSIWGFTGAAMSLTLGLLIMFGLTTLSSTMSVILVLPIALNEMFLAVWFIVKGFNTSAIAYGSVQTTLNEIK